MGWDYAENIFQLLSDLTALLICLFCYINNKRRVFIYGLLFFLCGLLSSYYWTTHLIIMGSWPKVFTLMAYSGWNLAYFFLFILVRYIQSPEESRFFHPLMLIPLPLDVLLLIFYLIPSVSDGTGFRTSVLLTSQFWIDIYLIIICNLIGVFSIRSLCWHWKNRSRKEGFPWIALAAVLIVLFAFAMQLFSNPYAPVSGLYYPFSYLSSLSYLFLVWAINRSVPRARKEPSGSLEQKFQNVLKASSTGIVIIFSVGGFMLAIWIRNMITQHIDPASASSVYDIIPIVLFIISLVQVIFVAAVALVVYFIQRTADNNKLREARQIAERSNAAKSEFLAAMSHEIRTPVNAVIGMNEIVLRESRQAIARLPKDSEDGRVFGDISNCAGIINTAGRNLLSLINDILDISRIEAGKMEIREDEYTLSSLLGDVCNLIGVRARSRDLAFRVNVDERLPDNLYGDVVRIRQIMLNILNNAVKYTEKGSVTLSVSSDPEDGFECGQVISLVFSVQDTGVGIRTEDLDKLFHKFERLGLAETRNVEGTGLGLMIVKNLLDMMDGAVWVRSKFGEGSTFTVSIPQKVVSPEPVGSFPGKSEGGTGITDVPHDLFRAPSARILVVDDTLMNLSVVEGLLKRTEMRIDTASGGEEALHLTMYIPYDLILMDQRMPGMDGVETMHLIRAQEGGANRETPVVCLTADVVSGAKKRYLAEGFTDYLSKPIDSRALRKTLIAMLPPEKVVLLRDTDELSGQSVPADTENEFAVLRAGGVNITAGLKYCQGDSGLYRTVLAEFAADAPERMERLEGSFAAGSWKDYALLAHSLKSTSGTIGALSLSESAAAMEAAAKAEDMPSLDHGHAPLLALYKQVSDAVRTFCPDAAPSPQDDDGVIEFMPE